MDTVTLVRSRDPGRARGLGRAGARPARGARAATTTTAQAASPPPTGTTPRLGRPSSTRSPATGRPCSTALEGEPLPTPLAEAATLLATVLGQDLEAGPDGRIRIARRVAPDRIISTVDPDSPPRPQDRGPRLRRVQGPRRARPRRRARHRDRGHAGQRGRRLGRPRPARGPSSRRPPARGPPLTVYGDAAYGTGPLLAALEAAGAVSRLKVQPASGIAGPLHQGRLQDRPRGGHRHLPGRTGRAVSGARPGVAGPLRPRLCRLPAGEPLHHARRTGAGSTSARTRRSWRPAAPPRRDPAWLADYRATRPKVERKLAHLVRRRHGGRRARVRGRQKVGADFALLAAAVNLARLAVLGLTGSGGAWAVRPA